MVFIGAIIAIAEKRFNHRQLGSPSLPYIYHGGMWADLIILTMICYWAQPYYQTWSEKEYGIAYLTGLVMTISTHVLYVRIQSVPGHIVNPFEEERLTFGGWWHAIYSLLVIPILVLFFVFTEEAPKFWPCVAMTCFVPMAVLQPGWYCAKQETGKGHIDAAGWLQAIAMWTLTWGIYLWWPTT